jgi:hypothetical protein
VILCEPICLGRQHIPVNVALVSAIVEYSNIDVKMYCEDEHWNILISQMAPNYRHRLSHYPIETLSRQDDLGAWLASFSLIKKLKKQSDDIIFLSSTSGLLDIAKRLIKKNKVFCTFHMALARVDKHLPRNPFVRWFSFDSVLRRFRGDGVKIIVLEETIAENLIAKYINLAGSVLCLPHPVEPFSQSDMVETKQINNTICFPGTFSLDKGAKDFTALALSVDKTAVSFIVAGKKSPSFCDYDTHLFKIKPNVEFLERQTFVSFIKSSQYLFLGHNEAIYKWCASGVYLDALKYEVPIIAKSSEFFRRENQIVGEIGFFYNHISEATAFINSKHFVERHNKFKINIKKLKCHRAKLFDDNIKLALAIND